jgi:hypothetical protein
MATCNVVADDAADNATDDRTACAVAAATLVTTVIAIVIAWTVIARGRTIVRAVAWRRTVTRRWTIARLLVIAAVAMC